MELLKQLQELQEKNLFNGMNILEVTNTEELMFIITEKSFEKEGKLNNLYSYFEELRAMKIKEGGLNIFQEHLTLKYFYLVNVYLIEEIIMDALLHLIGPVELDYLLEEVLEEDKRFKHYMKRYTEFKNDNEVTIFKLLNQLDIGELNMEVGELGDVMKQLQEFAGLEGEKSIDPAN